ncbi:MAG: hypothetical protein ACI95C_003025 [Pseudohongiellaceae bacterium]|jgi:hypothetical protein
MQKTIQAVFSLLLMSFSIHLHSAELERVFLQSRMDPNAITITAVDIVFLYDEALVDEFPKTKSRWYSMRRTLTQRYSDKMDVVSVFVPQGFDSETVTLPAQKGDAVKIYILAQHDDGSVAPIDITQRKDITVFIDGFGIIVTDS